MKKVALYFIRKTKALLIRYKIHLIIEPISGILQNLVYISKLSKWVKKTPMPEFDDFYSKKRDYSKRYKLYQYVIQKEKLDDIYYLEFGVAQGHSFKWWVENNDNKRSRFVGFDTFSGLPENWSTLYKRGSMSAPIPDINDNRCSFKVGLFQETLPAFLEEFNSNLRIIIHMDADIYSSTLYVLTSLERILKKGDIIFFDEFNVPKHEFKAFTDFVNSHYLKYEVIGAVNNYYQIAIKIL